MDEQLATMSVMDIGLRLGVRTRSACRMATITGEGSDRDGLESISDELTTAQSMSGMVGSVVP